MNKNTFKILIMLFALASLQACKKDDDTGPGTTRGQGFFVINEGSFQKGNGALGFVNTDNEYEDAVFEKENSRKLGDVFQSIFETDMHYFLVVNNSGKIEVLNKSTLKAEATIENLGSPRYMAMVGGKLWVNDLYSPKVTYFGTEAPFATTTMTLNGAAKGMATTSGFLHTVVNGKLVTIDTKAMQQSSDSMNFGLSLITVLSNGSDELYALGRGASDSLFALKIDANSKNLERKLFIEENSSWLSSFNYSAVNGKFSFLDKGQLYLIETSTFDNVAKLSAPSEATYVYSYSVHPITGEYYFCDAKDFVSNGEVFITDNMGALLNKVSVGINPNGCHFVNE